MLYADPVAAAVAAGLSTAPSSVPSVAPASPPQGRLFAQPLLLPAEGLYVTNDVPTFMVDRHEGQVRLRFLDSEEVFYLTSEPGSLGSRVLKYDTGDVALTVAGWGGVTLYTDEIKSGIPAERQTNAADFEPKPVSAKDIKPLADRLLRDLNIHVAFRIGFSADWDGLAKQSETARGLAVDSMRNATYALVQMAGVSERPAIAADLHAVRLVEATQPGVALEKGTLVISYAPKNGPSSRPIRTVCPGVARSTSNMCAARASESVTQFASMRSRSSSSNRFTWASGSRYAERISGPHGGQSADHLERDIQECVAAAMRLRQRERIQAERREGCETTQQTHEHELAPVEPDDESVAGDETRKQADHEAAGEIDRGRADRKSRRQPARLHEMIHSMASDRPKRSAGCDGNPCTHGSSLARRCSQTRAVSLTSIRSAFRRAED
jgi:hypothetical protein